jgi:hypothetical protein
MMDIETPKKCWALHKKKKKKNLLNCCIWLLNLFELRFSRLEDRSSNLYWLSYLVQYLSTRTINKLLSKKNIAVIYFTCLFGIVLCEQIPTTAPNGERTPKPYSIS